ncbi:MAG: vWA domain-containing protein [Actinomycetes bacterium]
MKRRLTTSSGVSFVVALLLVALSLLAAPLASPAKAASSDSNSALDAALNDVRACMSRENSVLNVYYLFDSSGSLVQGVGASDKQGLRFKALRQSIAPLADIAASGKQVYVAGGTFSDDAEPRLAWTEITSDSAADQADAIVAAMTTVAGGNTDWVDGLRLAESELSARAEATKGKRDCQVLVWITDGGIEIPVDDSLPLAEQVAADTAGINTLCGVGATVPGTVVPTGTMFSLRNSGVVVLGLLLQVSRTAAEPNQASRMSYFRPIVEGVGEVDGSHFGEGSYEFKCGEVVPGSQGAQIKVTKAEELARAFSLLARCVEASCTLPSPGTVASSRNADGTWTIAVPNGVSSLQLFTADAQWSILDPDGVDVCSASDKCTKVTGGGNVPVLGSPGDWTLTSADESTFWSYISGLAVSMNDAALMQGKEPAFTFAVTQDGEPVDPKRFASPLQLKASIKQPGASEPTDVPLSYEGGTWSLADAGGLKLTQSGVLTTTLSATAKGDASAQPAIHDLVLTDVVTRHDFTVEMPADFPRLVSPKLPDEFAAFSALAGTAGVASATLTFEGSKTADGQVCLPAEPAVLSDPGSADRADAWTWDAPECVDVPKGSTVDLVIEVRNPVQYDGLVKGTLPIVLHSSASSEDIELAVPFEMKTEMVKSGIAYVIVLILLILLGLAGPYVLLIWLARRQATFNQDLDGARWGAIPVTLDEHGLTHVQDLNPEDFKFIFFDGSGMQRSLTTGAETHTIAPPRWWPFRAPVTRVEASEGSVLVSNQGTIARPVGSVAVSSQALTDVFYFVGRRPESENPGQAMPEASAWDTDSTANAGYLGQAQSRSIAGHLVVIAASNTDLAGAIERAKITAQTWSMWPQAFKAITDAEAPADPKPAKAKEPKPADDKPKKNKKSRDQEPPPAASATIDW